MYSILLALVYIAFISLGLPDSLVGSAWPVMHNDLNVPVSYAGLVTMTIAIGTIVSSLLSDRLTKKLGTGVVTAVSVGMTATALVGFSFTHSFVLLLLWAIPYGLGAGAVDAALNNYVALHYPARHMSWLHCFWGVGASISPLIMSAALANNNNWNGGYWTVGLIQVALTFVLIMSLPLWSKQRKAMIESEEVVLTEPIPLSTAIRIPGVPFILVVFFAYCAFESTAMLWGSSYLVQFRDVDTTTAARFAALFVMGITLGRFLSGFVAEKLGDERMIRIGLVTSLIGTVLVALPLGTDVLALTGLVVAGLGCAPIYPAIIHATPVNFGRENSQAIIGIQMASAYVGTTLMPPLFGFLAEKISMGLFPFFLMIFGLLTLTFSERLKKVVGRGDFTHTMRE